MPSAVACHLPAGYDLARTVRVHAFGRRDPTTQVGRGDVWRATRTPDGPGTLHVRHVGDGLEAEAWGPGAGWLLDGVEAFAGLHRPTPPIEDHHPLVTRAQHRHPGLAIGANRSIMHTLVPAILGQRVTGFEAMRSWAALCRRLGEPAPGPERLLLPPAPDRLASTPSWWFHRLGVERRRAETIIRAAAVAHRLEEVVDGPLDLAYQGLRAVSGIGAWTAAEVAGAALGDLDAVSVGDYHLPNVVSYALAGEPRGTDERMLELLAPWVGHRAIVLRLLLLDGPAPPAYGPRQRIMPIARL